MIYILKYLAKSKEDSMQHPLNQILYGPPGTGKTYNTINRALEIIDGVVPEDREKAREKFNKYRDEGQIEFVTFHQSYGYEEFVEGIKADLKSGEIKYILEDGIFKELVNKALIKGDFLVKLNIYINNLRNEPKILYTTEGNQFTVTISPNEGIKTSTNHSFSKEKLIEIDKGIKRNNPDSTYGQHIVNDINKINNFPLKNYILIIDEINRGNISKIFGELITLIEPSKRLGADEELKLTLPNSKELFGVPSNLYIIGTMNTADRSIAQIDTALRRRFEFVEMMPDHSLLKDVTVVDEDKKIEIEKVLEAINERIESIYDREHTIGHSYFLPLIKEPTKKKLDEIFKVNILPLLAEYFYGDWEDIRFVLNNDFVKEKESSKYIKNSSRQLNKVYEINKAFEESEYLKIYATDNN
jgi:5-methylcytosine-specific restriction protein B